MSSITPTPANTPLLNPIPSPVNIPLLIPIPPIPNPISIEHITTSTTITSKEQQKLLKTVSFVELFFIPFSRQQPVELTTALGHCIWHELSKYSTRLEEDQLEEDQIDDNSGIIADIQLKYPSVNNNNSTIPSSSSSSSSCDKNNTIPIASYSTINAVLEFLYIEDEDNKFTVIDRHDTLYPVPIGHVKTLYEAVLIQRPSTSHITDSHIHKSKHIYSLFIYDINNKKMVLHFYTLPQCIVQRLHKNKKVSIIKSPFNPPLYRLYLNQLSLYIQQKSFHIWKPCPCKYHSCINDVIPHFDICKLTYVCNELQFCNVLQDMINLLK